MLEVTLPDGSKRQYDAALSVAQIAESIGAGLAKAALAGRINGELVDLSTMVERDAEIAIITERDSDASRSSATAAPISWRKLYSVYSRQLR